jgi:molybdenum cofactor cytidylyltransferase
MSALRFSAVVLAAGSSTRMPGKHKLLLPLGDETVVRRTAREVLGARPEEAVVVTGCNAQAVANALTGLRLTLHFNPRYEEGQMTSVAAGVAALTLPCDAVMICLGDMALLESADYRELMAAYASRPHGSIIVPRRGAMRGNPVVFALDYKAEVIAGDRNLGCRKLITDHPEKVFAYESAHDRFFVDLDTPDDYARHLERLAVPAAPAS